jgi:hypothetical protein
LSTSRPSRRQFFLILVASVTAASIASHIAVAWLGLSTSNSSSYHHGNAFTPPPINALGSSLTFYGINWETVSESTRRPVNGTTGPAASPAELDIIAPAFGPGDLTVIGVSAFDMNERSLSDFRADTVPFLQTISDLRASGTNWELTKRTLSQYPRKFVRLAFPSAGRSLGVMVGVRSKIRAGFNLLRTAQTHQNNPAQPSIGSSFEVDETIASWKSDRLLRNVALMKARLRGGQHSFSGTKSIALDRLLSRASQNGPALLMVMPLSPAYRAELLTAEDAAAFEARLRRIQQDHPSVSLLRLDQMQDLSSNELYWDLVHLNTRGKRLATAALLAQIQPALTTP